MSLDATFLLDAHTTPGAVQSVLAKLDGFEVQKDWKQLKCLAADGVAVTVLPDVARDGIAKQAEISPTITVSLPCADIRKRDAWNVNIVRALVALLHAYPGDALFMYCTDSPALLRKGGRIILDKRAGLWDAHVEPQVLHLVDLPYNFGHIPVM